MTNNLGQSLPRSETQCSHLGNGDKHAFQKGCHKEGVRSWQPRPGGHSLLIHVITATFDRAFPTTLHGMLSFPCFRLREGNFSHSSTPSQPPYQGQLTPPSQALIPSLQPPASWLWLLRSEWLSVSCSNQNLWLTQAASKWQSPEVTQCFSDRLLLLGGGVGTSSEAAWNPGRPRVSAPDAATLPRAGLGEGRWSSKACTGELAASVSF